MVDKFIDYIDSEQIFSEKDNFLLGISGGLDSMVMLDLFSATSFRIAVAHCNFGLRDKESDADQSFVEDVCNKKNIKFYTKRFDTKDYALERGISIQMAARELRYIWFDRLSADLDYSCIAIAHNKNDLVETFLLNLSRGTGIKGLTGIKSRNGKIVRPLLFAGRQEITAFADKNKIQFREDSSNRETRYKRNHIRHKIIPEFENVNPAFTGSVAETARRLRETEIIYSQAIEHHFKRICQKTGQVYYLDIGELKKLSPLNTYLFEFLRKWQFPGELIPDIISSLSASSGKQFYSPTHRIVKDREKLIITPVQETGITRYYIEESTTELYIPVNLKLTRIKNVSGFRMPVSPSIACIDLHLLLFPLILRKWEKGDYFQPLGMSGLKKVSDFFIDNKFSLIDKENTWIIASGNKVVWIAGHRLDDRFKISERTKEILMIEFFP
jgi:tRNA(Ile)-lysidine synthase